MVRFLSLALFFIVISGSLGSNEYLYKRGFLYSQNQPYYVPSTYDKIGDNLWVDKSQRVTFSDDKHCLIIGFCVDIQKPELTMESIANELAKALEDSEEQFREIEQFLCGRYVIFYKTKDNIDLLATDATGLRPVFHDKQASLITSHAKLLAINIQKKDISRDQRILYFDEQDPCRRTQFEGVYQLNPNTSLELGSGKMHRIFPYQNVGSISKHEIVQHLVSMVGGAIKGLIQNQAKPLLLSLTAGYDSRATLSIMLLNNIKPDLCFTYIRPNNPKHYHHQQDPNRD